MVERPAVARDCRAVGDLHCRHRRGAALAFLEAIELTAAGGLGIVHTAEPDPPCKIGCGIVQAIARQMRLGIMEVRERSADGIEAVKARADTREHVALNRRQRPADLVRRLPLLERAGGGDMAIKRMPLDIHEPERSPGPNRPFAERQAQGKDRFRRHLSASLHRRNIRARCTARHHRTRGRAQARQHPWAESGA